MKYKTILADPPWDIKFGEDNHRERRRSTGSPKGTWSRPKMNYETMSLKDISALRVSEMAEPNAHLYIWTINKYIEQTYAVARAWGFKPICLLTWAKTPRGMGLGGTFVQTTEHILFCRRGMNIAKERCNTSWWNWTRPENITGPMHSRKPELAQGMIEIVSPGPYLEMFARRPRAGWDVWGDEIESTVQIQSKEQA